MKNKIFLLIIVFVSIKCSTKLIKTQKVNGIIIEKLNLKVIDDHINAKYPKSINSKKNLELDQIETVVISGSDGSAAIDIYASKANDEYTSLSRHIRSDSIEEVQQFYPNGNLKLREKTTLHRTVDTKDGGKIDIAPTKFEKLEYFDKNGILLQSVDYSLLYKYSLKDVIVFVRSQPENKDKNYTVSMLYLNDVLYLGSYQNFLNEVNKTGVDLKRNYPYWVINCYIKNQVKTIYLDGEDGAIIGTTANTTTRRLN